MWRWKDFRGRFAAAEDEDRATGLAEAAVGGGDLVKEIGQGNWSRKLRNKKKQPEISHKIRAGLMYLITITKVHVGGII